MLVPLTANPEFYEVVYTTYCSAGGGTFQYEVVKHRRTYRILGWIVDDYEVTVPRYGRKKRQVPCDVHIATASDGAFGINAAKSFSTLAAAKAYLKRRLMTHFSTKK